MNYPAASGLGINRNRFLIAASSGVPACGGQVKLIYFSFCPKPILTILPTSAKWSEILFPLASQEVLALSITFTKVIPLWITR